MDLPPEITHRRLLITMAVVILVETAIGFTLFSAKAGSGVLIGGVLAFANYYWQRRSLKAIFDRAIQGDQARFLAVRYISRYVVIGAAVSIVYLTDLAGTFPKEPPSIPVIWLVFGNLAPSAPFGKVVALPF